MQFLLLKIFKNSQLLKTKIFKAEDQISVGSSEGLTLQLDGISPWHLLIEKKHDIFVLLDLNSEMGTLLNGQKVTEETVLKSSSVIALGPYEIHFFIEPSIEKTISLDKVKKPVSKQEASDGSLVKQEKIKQPVPSSDRKENDFKEQASENSSVVFSSSRLSRDQVKKEEPITNKISKESSSKLFKPKQKGFWNTYAPPGKIKNLDEFLDPSVGNLIEVLVCWKERILKSHCFSESGDVFMGYQKSCQIKIPNMQGMKAYKLLTISSGAQVHLSHSVTGCLFQGKNKDSRTSHKLNGNQNCILKPYEMIRLDFNSVLKVYIRLMDKPRPIPFAGLFNLKVSEMMALFFAFLLTGLLVFYGTLYAPAFLSKEENFIEKDIRIAQVVFNKKPIKKVVKLDLKETQKVTKKISLVTQKKVSLKPKIKKIKRVKKKLKTVKKINTPKKGKTGKMAALAPGKKNIKKRTKVGSARPGGSLKTGQKGSSAKTVAQDPTKMGLLGTFGSGGVQNKLDKAASGSGGLLGLADQSTGLAGTQESYKGEGVGTKTKELSSGGKGSSLIGISGIKTKGKGLGVLGLGSGGLGQRGRMNIEFGTEDIEVSGEIDRSAILAVLKRNQSKFSLCYNKSLNQNPSAQGSLGMQWQIATNGKGYKAKVLKNEIGISSFGKCVADVLENLRFPTPPSGQIPEVSFTFRFYQ